jgi:hypothetical protein
MLEPLSQERRERIVAAMKEVDRLLTVTLVMIGATGLLLMATPLSNRAAGAP